MFEVVARATNIAVRTLTGIACAALALVVLVLGYDVTLRYFGHSSIAGLHEGVSLAFIFIYMFGVVDVYAREMDVDIDALAPRLSPRAQIVKRMLVNLLLAATFAVTAWYAAQMMDASWRERTPVLRLPAFLYQFALLLAAALISLVSVLQIWRGALSLTTGKTIALMPAKDEINME